MNDDERIVPEEKRKEVKCPYCKKMVEEPIGWDYLRCPKCDMYIYDNRDFYNSGRIEEWLG